MILPEASAEVGEQALQRVRQVMEETNQLTVGPAVQFSIGLATATTTAEDLREVLRKADENMYQDKRTRGLYHRSGAADPSPMLHKQGTSSHPGQAPQRALRPITTRLKMNPMINPMKKASIEPMRFSSSQP